MDLTEIRDYQVDGKICNKLCFSLYEGMSRLTGEKRFLKVLDEALSKDETCVFDYLNGARLSSLLECNQVCRVYHYGKEAGHYVIVSEHVAEKSLSLFLQEQFPLDMKHVTDIINNIARTLREVHLRGLVHSVLNPSCIFVNEEGYVKLDDFGYNWAVPYLFQREEPESTYLSHYLSPEVYFHRGRIDGRADIYSLGVVFLQLLTDNFSLNGHVNATFKHSLLLATMHKAKRIYPKNAEQIEKILTRALSLNPGDRYQNMNEFAAAMKVLKPEMPAVGAIYLKVKKSPKRPGS